MSAAQDRMTAAVISSEQALQQLAAAFADYTSAYSDVAHTVSAPSGLQPLEHAVGTERLAQLVAGRLVGLGMERVVMQTTAPAGAEQVDWLIAQIAAHVPAEVGA